jgi:preprotein translocase subunit SecE
VADADKVDPADEPDTSATPGEPEDPAPTSDGAVNDGEVRESDGDSGDRELVAAGRAESRASRSAAKRPEGELEPASRGDGATRGKKDKPTPKQKRDTAEHQRTGPVTFVRQSVGELRKVVYPTGPQLANYFVVVLIFVLFIIAYVSLLDLGLGAAIFRIFA